MDPLRRARTFGWWSLLVWLSLGMVLEAMHGFKIGWYLDVGNDTRRLMLSLAHTHGTLIALVNLLLVATTRPSDANPARLARAATCLRWAGILMPLGFLLAGLQLMGADPGFAIVLVPIGGLFLFLGVLSAARTTDAASTDPTSPASGPSKDNSKDKKGAR